MNCVSDEERPVLPDPCIIIIIGSMLLLLPPLWVASINGRRLELVLAPVAFDISIKGRIDDELEEESS